MDWFAVGSGSIQIFRESTCLWCSHILLHFPCKPARSAAEVRGPPALWIPMGNREKGEEKGMFKGPDLVMNGM